MENLNLSPTNYTPEVNFDFNTGILELSGTATPEDSVKFFQPVLDWVEQYKINPASKTSLVFRMEYFNTSSTVFILRLMKSVARLSEADKQYCIKWYHQVNDEDTIEAGRDFGVLAKTTIELIPY